MRAREADSLDSVHGIAGVQQRGEVDSVGERQVTAIRVDVLTEQGQLPDALVGESCRLGDDLVRASALFAAADAWDDAVGAVRVAAHRYLHPGLEAARTVHRQLAREGALLEPEGAARDPFAAGADPVGEVRDRAGAEGDVDVRVELEDALALRLRVAAADGDDLAGITALQRGCLREVGGELLVGLLPDRARVEHEHVGLVLRRGLPQAELLEHALDPLGVVRVHLTPERCDVVPLHRPGQDTEARLERRLRCRGTRFRLGSAVPVSRPRVSGFGAGRVGSSPLRRSR